MRSINLDLLKRPMIFGTIIGVVILAIVWWFAWMSPEGSKLTNANAQQVTLQQQAAQLQVQINALRIESEQVQKELPYLRVFQSAVPPLPEQGNLTKQLYDLSLHTKTFISSLNDSTITGATGSSVIPVSMTITGTRNGVLNFLNGIYSLPRLVTVQSVTLSPPPAAANLNTPNNDVGFSATLNATAYTSFLPSVPRAA